ncbi:hypothetical protein ISCGN_001549 [Ixodes scapularis]
MFISYLDDMKGFVSRIIPARSPCPLTRARLSLEDIVCGRCRPPVVADAGASQMLADKKAACLVDASVPRGEGACQSNVTCVGSTSVQLVLESVPANKGTKKEPISETWMT